MGVGRGPVGVSRATLVARAHIWSASVTPKQSTQSGLAGAPRNIAAVAGWRCAAASQGHDTVAQSQGSSPTPICGLDRACRAQFCPTAPLWLERAGHNRKVSSGAAGARIWRGGKPVHTCDKPEAQEQSGATPNRILWQPSDCELLSHETVERTKGNQGEEQHKGSGQTV